MAWYLVKHMDNFTSASVFFYVVLFSVLLRAVWSNVCNRHHFLVHYRAFENPKLFGILYRPQSDSQTLV